MSETVPDEIWRPLSEVPTRTAMHIEVRTPKTGPTTYRWLPYKNSAGYPWRNLGGRWQIATEYNWRNQDLPSEGEWRATPRNG